MRVILSAGLFLLGRVDPGCAWQFRRGGWLGDEALGVSGVGGVQDLGAGGPDGRGVAVVDVGGGVQAEAAVAVVVVVPAEEVLAVRAGGLDRAEPGRERRPVFQGLVVNTDVEGGRWQFTGRGAVREMEVCWSSRVALRGEALNHPELHWLKTVVVNVVGKGAARLRQVRSGKMSDGRKPSVVDVSK